MRIAELCLPLASVLLVACRASDDGGTNDVRGEDALNEGGLCGEPEPLVSDDGRFAIVEQCNATQESLARVDLASGARVPVAGPIAGPRKILLQESGGGWFSYSIDGTTHLRDFGLAQDIVLSADGLAPNGAAHVDHVSLVGRRAIVFASEPNLGQFVATVSLDAPAPLGAPQPKPWPHPWASLPGVEPIELLDAVGRRLRLGGILPGNDIETRRVLGAPDGSSVLLFGWSKRDPNDTGVASVRLDFTSGAPTVTVLRRDVPDANVSTWHAWDGGTSAYYEDVFQNVFRYDLASGASSPLGTGIADPVAPRTFYVSEKAPTGRTLVRYADGARTELGAVEKTDSLSVSPDGKWLFVSEWLPFEGWIASAPAKITVVPTDASSPPRVLRAKSFDTMALGGGKALLMDQQRVDVVDVATGNTLASATMPDASPPPLFGVFTASPDASRIFVSASDRTGDPSARTTKLYEITASGTVVPLRTDVGVVGNLVFASGVHDWLQTVRADGTATAASLVGL